MDIPDSNMNDLVQALVVLCLQKINDQRVPGRDIVGRRRRMYIMAVISPCCFSPKKCAGKKKQKTIENMHNLNMFSIFHPEPRDIFPNCLGEKHHFDSFSHPPPIHHIKKKSPWPTGPGDTTARFSVNCLNSPAAGSRFDHLSLTPPKKKHSWTGKIESLWL